MDMARGTNRQFYLDHETYKVMKRHANARDISHSELLRRAVRYYANRHPLPKREKEGERHV